MSKKLVHNPNFKRPKRLEGVKKGDSAKGTTVRDEGSVSDVEDVVEQEPALVLSPPKLHLNLPRPHLIPEKSKLLKLTEQKPSPLKVVLPPEGVQDLVEALSPRSACRSPKEPELVDPSSPKSLLGSGFVFAEQLEQVEEKTLGEEKTVIEEILNSKATSTAVAGAAEPTTTLEQVNTMTSVASVATALPGGASTHASIMGATGAAMFGGLPQPKLSAVQPLLIEKPPTFATKPKLTLFTSNPLTCLPQLREKYLVPELEKGTEARQLPWHWAPTLLQAVTKPKAPLSTTLDWTKTVLPKPQILLSQPDPMPLQPLTSADQEMAQGE
ncbi:unnamed protein product [Amoebophrya sp. A120]|nr:unnamed protein product [Amoebophrya sp. A120]|eukprot:GSA120T00005716001.1